MSNKKDFFKQGTGHIVSSSHNDIAWFDTPYKTMEFRDINIITPAIEMVKKDANFKHTMECVLYLMEYLDRHPECKDELKDLAKDGRLMWGATYTQPYEGMFHDEALVRQVYLGKKWIETLFPETKARVAWSPDVPGRSMQFPQILAKAGIDYLMISRLNSGAFEWFSPDGSSVKGFSTGHYSTSSHPLHLGTKEALEKIDEILTLAKPHYEKYNLPPEYLFLSVEDYVEPRNFAEFIEKWTAEGERKFDVPNLKHSSMEEFLDALTSNPESSYIEYHGERPNEWAYIHGATHHRDMAYGRRGSALMPEAEAFSVISCLLNQDMSQYPTNEIFEGWKNILYPDHGFGGGNGHITDQVFAGAMKKGCDIANELKIVAMKDISAKIKVQDSGLPIVIFNGKGHSRTDIVTYKFDIRKVPSRYFKIEDEKGVEVDYQIINEESAFELTIAFLASDVPSIGYKVYYIRETQTPTKTIWLKETHRERTVKLNDWGHKELADLEPLAKPIQTYENDFYKIVLDRGGMSSLFDKQAGKELLDTTHFKGFELFMMQSHGSGAGEFEAIQQATFDSGDAMKNYPLDWELIEDGVVRTTFGIKTKFSHCYIVQRISLYKDIKKIDCDILIEGFDGTEFKEYRMALPLAMEDAQVTYHVPMGAVEIGKDEVKGAMGTEFFNGYPVPRYTTPVPEIHPREVLDWMSASDDKVTVMLNSDVSLFDYINPRDLKDNKPMLQPILFASRVSCHGWGNDYFQRGNHSFHFTFTSAEGNWKENVHLIDGANTPLTAIEVDDTKVEKTLPETNSFFGIDKENIVISSIKKCEDDDSVILRVYEQTGKEVDMSLASYFNVKNIERTDIIENSIEGSELKVNAPIKITKRSIDTFKINE